MVEYQLPTGGSLTAGDNRLMMAAERADPIAALIEATATVGIEVADTRELGSTAELVIPEGERIPIVVKRLSLASADGLPGRLVKWERRVADSRAIRIVVADRVTNDARELLRGAGWSWLDLRGHLHLSAPGLFVDTDVATVKGRGQRTSPFSGRGGIEVAVELLLDPYVSQGVRRIADRIGRSPSTVSEVMTSLRSSSLIDAERKPVLPDLFWALAAEWRTVSADVQTALRHGQPLFVALDLAQDADRGREVLKDWTPPEPWHRVW